MPPRPTDTAARATKPDAETEAETYTERLLKAKKQVWRDRDDESDKESTQVDEVAMTNCHSHRSFVTRCNLHAPLTPQP